MVDRDMLEAISDMMDDKLVEIKEDVRGLNQRMDNLEGSLTHRMDNLEESLSCRIGSLEEGFTGLTAEVHILKTDVAELKTDVAELKTDVAELKTDVAELKTDVAELKTDMVVVKTDIDSMKNNMGKMQTDIDKMQTDITKLQLTQENEILPILRDLSDCYVDTYDRYRQGVDEHEEMKQDIEVLKVVVSEHSKILQKIS